MALKIKLIKSFAGAPDTQLRTIAGLGLRKFGQERILQDTPSIRGMVFKVKHLVSQEVVDAARGAAVVFREIGPVELKGVGGAMHLHAASLSG